MKLTAGATCHYFLRVGLQLFRFTLHEHLEAELHGLRATLIAASAFAGSSSG